MEPSFSDLNDGERAWIAEQLEAARRFTERHSPADPGPSDSLERLDRAWNAWIASAPSDGNQVNEVLNAVGVQLGEALVERAGFEWTIVNDEYGTELGIRALPGAGDVVVFPANFVAKRWEAGETGFLAKAFANIAQQVNSTGKPAGRETPLAAAVVIARTAPRPCEAAAKGRRHRHGKRVHGEQIR